MLVGRETSMDARDGTEQIDAGECVEVHVGYLVTHADGYQVRMDLDRTRVELYAARNHATIELMFVRRAARSS